MTTLYISNLGILEPLGQTQIIPYLKGLAEKGIKIYLLSFEKRFNLSDSRSVSLQEREMNKCGIHWRRLRYHHRWGNLLDLFLGLLVAGHMVSKRKIDVIHARASIPAMIGFLLSGLLQVKFIYDRRGTMVGDFIDDVDKSSLLRFKFFSNVLERLEEKIMRCADSTVVLSGVISEILRKRFASDGGINTVVIPCCVDLNKFNIDLPKDKELLKKYNLEDKFIFIYSGSLGTCYKFKEMLDFFKSAKDEIDNAHFLILTQSDVRIAEKFITESNADLNDLTIVNAQPRDVPRYIRLSNVALIFIKQTFSKLASCPTKVAECLACGVPIIVNSGMGDIDSMVKKDKIGVVVEEFLGSEYKVRIKEYLDTIRPDESVTRRCFQAAKDNFSLRMGIERYDGVYRHIMGQGRVDR